MVLALVSVLQFLFPLPFLCQHFAYLAVALPTFRHCWQLDAG